MSPQDSFHVRYRKTSPIWGDESEAVNTALTWAVHRTVVASDPKATARDAADLARDVGQTITKDGIGARRAMELFDTVALPASRAPDDPYNLAYIPSAPTRAAVAFDTVVSTANIFGGTWEAGSGAIHLENQAIAWLISLLDWPASAAGAFVAGGTLGNLSALAAARHAADTSRGRPEGGWFLACSEGAHSSVAAAAQILDVGVLTVPTDARGHLTGAALDEALGARTDVFAVVASAGTTNTGIVDDLADIADVCEKRGLWWHVDGAYGGAALASPTARAMFAGIERADSFIVDPHKWLFAPYDCCALIYRDAARAAAAHSQHASYLEAIDRSQFNPADLAIHLSRRTRGLPLWFSLATHGTEAYGRAIDTCMQTAREIADGIDALEHLELLVPPELSVVTFRRPGWSRAEYARWSHRLATDGVLLIVPTTYEEETALRIVVVNPLTRADFVLKILSETMR
ncbi:MAG: aminotransferase class V-fold PLP-dependent enzyme [Bowdeniella nasicola]|nr:aminotransferase class V-fold PLP-dependent enzyme [Bowdeniella nasicola]